jgi:hypothetical protein
MANLPTGVRQVKFGQAEVMDELVTDFVVAVIAGVLLVFAVLVLLYKRVLPPFVNMGSLLLAPLGAVIALILTGNALTMPVYIGILMLFGIVAKNSILLVDFAIEEMRHGVDRETAIIDAGHKRAQPILMTTVAMTAGMLPVAIGLHGDSSFRAPMAICGDRRAVAVHRAHAAHRAGGLHAGGRSGALDRPQACPHADGRQGWRQLRCRNPGRASPNQVRKLQSEPDDLP